MAHHHQRDLINNDEADRLKLPVHAPPPPVVATGTMPLPLALPPPACSSPVSSPRDANTVDGPFHLPPDTAAAADQTPLPPASPESSPASADATASAPAATAAPARCASCRKRLGLSGFRCRCGVLYCGVHRYSDRHACTFDYKAQAREAIARDNPAYKAPKLLRI